MNPQECNPKNLITLTPIKKQIKGRTDITVPFRIQKDEKQEKALIQFEGVMKVFERDGIYSLGITIPQHLEFDETKSKSGKKSTHHNPEKILIEHLEKTIQQKAKEIKLEILKLLPKLKFFPRRFPTHKR